MTMGHDGAARVLDLSIPSSARIWNYWLGGKDNYVADRAAGDAFAQLYPPIFALAKQSRRFLVRTVEFLAAEVGIRQFLDIGTGLPVLQNTHDVALAVAPEARTVYVDNDPMVLAHARVLQTNPGRTDSVAYVEADIRDTERLISAVSAELDMSQPVAVLFLGMLGYVEDDESAHHVVGATMAAMPAGSHLALWDSTRSPAFDLAMQEYNRTGGERYHLRGVEELRGFFHGLELLTPGIVPITEWRRDRIDADIAVDGYGGVARKP